VLVWNGDHDERRANDSLIKQVGWRYLFPKVGGTAVLFL
jgi:hypothetical protein